MSHTTHGVNQHYKQVSDKRNDACADLPKPRESILPHGERNSSGQSGRAGPGPTWLPVQGVVSQCDNNLGTSSSCWATLASHFLSGSDRDSVKTATDVHANPGSVSLSLILAAASRLLKQLRALSLP